MLNLIKGEILKLKRSSTFKISLLGSCVTPLMLLLVIWNISVMNNSPMWSFEVLFEQSLTYLCVMFGLLLNILISSYLFNREYSEHTLKTILSTHVTKDEYLISKLVVFILWSFLNTFITWLLVLIIGVLFKAPNLTISLIFTSLLNHFIADILLCLITIPTILITLIFKNIIPSIIVGMGVVLGSFMIMNSKFAGLYPTTSIFYLVTGDLGIGKMYNFDPKLPLIIIGAIFIVGCMLTWIYFRNTDVQL